MKSINTTMRTIYLFVTVLILLVGASVNGAVMKSMSEAKPTEALKKKKENQRHRRNMEKPTTSPTAAPITPSPTGTPTETPTANPTSYPTAYPTEKKSMERSPQAFVAPTSFPVVVVVPTPVTQTFTNAPVVVQSPAANSPATSNPPSTNPPVALPATNAPVTVVTDKPTNAPITIAPTSLRPTILPSDMPTDRPSAKPSNEPSARPSGSPIVSTNVPTALPTVAPTYSNLTSQMPLRDFNILLISFDESAINVGQVESALEMYMNQTMMLENLVGVALTPVTASSAQGSNFTATSIQFAGKASFVIEVPTQITLSLSQNEAISSSVSISDIQEAISSNPNLNTVRIVGVSYDPLDPKSIVDAPAAAPAPAVVNGDNKETNSDVVGKDNGGLIIGLVLCFSAVLVGGALYGIRHRRNTRGNRAENTTGTTKPISARKMGDSHYPSLRNQYPDIEKPKEESVKTPNEDDEDDEDSSAADLSSYMMTPTGSQATEVRGSTTVLKNKDKISDNTVIRTTLLTTNETEARPTVEISVSHIAEVDDDEDYTSTDDGSAKFGATDMSECTFRG